MTDSDLMRQEAPYPKVLADLVSKLRYKAGWRFWLADLDRGQGSKGLTLVINIHEPDAYHPERNIAVNHYMIVPAASYDERSWRRWLFDQIGLVDDHERMENFCFPVPPRYDTAIHSHLAQPDDRPYAPSHGFGQNPYLVREIGTEEDQRTSFRNELNANPA